MRRRAVIDHLREHACAPSPDGPERLGIGQEWHTYCLAANGGLASVAEPAGEVLA